MWLSVISSNITLKNLKRYFSTNTGSGSFNVSVFDTAAGEYFELSSIFCSSGVGFGPSVVTFNVIDNDSGVTIFSFNAANLTGTQYYSRMSEEMQGTTSQPKLFNIPPNCNLRMAGTVTVVSTFKVTGRAIINSP